MFLLNFVFILILTELDCLELCPEGFDEDPDFKQPGYGVRIDIPADMRVYAAPGEKFKVKSVCLKYVRLCHRLFLAVQSSFQSKNLFF